MNTVELTEEQGELLQELSYENAPAVEVDGHSYVYEGGEDNVEEHRWATSNLYVYKRDDGKLFGMLYDIGSTEEQESGFVYNKPQLYEVFEQKVTVSVYEAVGK